MVQPGPRWRWSNIPVPLGYVIPLLAGIAVHLLLPARMFPMAWIGHAAGWPVLLAGLLLAAWAVSTAGDMDVARPTEVVVWGPYRLSRNPMYLAWTLISLGIGLMVNSGWVVMFLPTAVLFTHRLSWD